MRPPDKNPDKYRRKILSMSEVMGICPRMGGSPCVTRFTLVLNLTSPWYFCTLQWDLRTRYSVGYVGNSFRIQSLIMYWLNLKCEIKNLQQATSSVLSFFIQLFSNDKKDKFVFYHVLNTVNAQILQCNFILQF